MREGWRVFEHSKRLYGYLPNIACALCQPDYLLKPCQLQISTTCMVQCPPPWFCHYYYTVCREVCVGDLKVPRTQPACLVPFALLSQTFTPLLKLQRRESGREDTLTHLTPVSQQQINIITRSSSTRSGEVL